jgi:hypothetical protein
MIRRFTKVRAEMISQSRRDAKKTKSRFPLVGVVHATILQLKARMFEQRGKLS